MQGTLVVINGHVYNLDKWQPLWTEGKSESIQVRSEKGGNKQLDKCYATWVEMYIKITNRLFEMPIFMSDKYKL